MVNYAAHVYIEINDDFFAQPNQGPNSSGSSTGNCVEYWAQWGEINFSTGGPQLTLFFETLKKQPCKQKTVLLEEWFCTKLKNC